MSEREEYICKAKIAEKLERFGDMMEAMNVVTNLNYELSIEERNLLSIAYKSSVSKCRSQLYKLIALEKEENAAPKEWLQVYRSKITQELCDVCNNMLIILEKHINHYSSAILAKIFYIKLKGDYYRYMAEFTQDEEREIASENALAAYEAAREIAEVQLNASHPARLSVALNFGVFNSRILKSPEQAYLVSKLALDEADADEHPFLSIESRRETSLFMKMLRDNIKMWTNSNDEDEPEFEDANIDNDLDSENIVSDIRNICRLDIDYIGSIHTGMDEPFGARNFNIQDMTSIPAAMKNYQMPGMQVYQSDDDSYEAIEVPNVDEIDSNVHFNTYNAGDQARRSTE